MVITRSSERRLKHSERRTVQSVQYCTLFSVGIVNFAVELNYVMRKRLITPIFQDVPPLDEGWLNLDGAAVVEVTSEETDYPIESALVLGETRGWRAADSGAQTIRLVFDESQTLKRIALVFEESDIERTQARGPFAR
jgi:hypothetical protein